MNVLAIIQARMGSTRLPGKVLLSLEGKTVIEHVVERVKCAKLVDEVIVATSININNLPLIRVCAEKNIRVFCGSEEDVLDRFFQLAKLLVPAHIVRITADCPVIDPAIIDKIIATHFLENADYTSNTIDETYPDGLVIEIFTYKSLTQAWNEASLSSEREHVTPYIKKHPELKRERGRAPKAGEIGDLTAVFLNPSKIKGSVNKAVKSPKNLNKAKKEQQLTTAQIKRALKG